MACEHLGQLLSLQIEAKEQARELLLAEELRRAHDKLMGAMSAERSIFDAPERFEELVKGMIPCDGYGVWSEKGFNGVGAVPPADAMPDLIRHLGERDPHAPYATGALSRELPSASAYVAEASGVLSIPFSRMPREYLLFLARRRTEVRMFPTRSLAAVYQGLRGGLQIGLGLGPGGKGEVSVVEEPATLWPRRHFPGPALEEEMAHREFVQTLGPKAIWGKYLDLSEMQLDELDF